MSPCFASAQLESNSDSFQITHLFRPRLGVPLQLVPRFVQAEQSDFFDVVPQPEETTTRLVTVIVKVKIRLFARNVLPAWGSSGTRAA